MVTSPPHPSPSLDAPVTLVALVTPVIMQPGGGKKIVPPPKKKSKKENSSENGLKLQENWSNHFFEIENYTIVLMI